MATAEVVLSHVHDECSSHDATRTTGQADDGIQELHLGHAVIACLNVTQVAHVTHQVLRGAVPVLHV